MKKIAIISDTHSYVHPSVVSFVKNCDEVWHAGDIGNNDVVENFSANKIFRAVWGNIDDYKTRASFPEYQIFTIEESLIIMTHIGGYPDKYEKEALKLIKHHRPNIFISGHSHILKVLYDKKYNLLHINPGAAGKYGFHNLITAIRFEINGRDYKNLEILEIKK